MTPANQLRSPISPPQAGPKAESVVPTTIPIMLPTTAGTGYNYASAIQAAKGAALEVVEYLLL